MLEENIEVVEVDVRARLLLAVVAWGCTSEPPEEAVVCSQVCDALVQDCSVLAYPDKASCEQGCLYDVSVGADLVGLQTCVDEAACDPFGLVACGLGFSPVEGA